METNSITAEALTENIGSVIDYINEQIESAGGSMKAMTQIDVAADEVLANICSYAYAPGSGLLSVGVTIDSDSGIAIISFADSGRQFNPLESEDPDVTLPAEERALGGLGIFITKKTMDKVSYRYEDGQNILTLEKRIKEK